ncbi:hypothetical protein [Actinoplanes italicus]|uniref:hypothetical protein n=1 Tax=Actinoplanes italicus TaxID=113567 RepID=UPI001473BD37|nr:hypothetical protein [Actinoplanes italicus]
MTVARRRGGQPLRRSAGAETFQVAVSNRAIWAAVRVWSNVGVDGMSCRASGPVRS